MLAVVSEFNPMTTAGDLIVAAAAGRPTRLGIGSAGQVLSVSAGGAVVWGPPGSVAFPVSSAGDQGFQPDGIANSALTLQNAAGAGTGLILKGNAAGAGTALTVASSAGAEALTVDAKGTGTITIAGTSTGAIVLGQITTLSKGTKSTVISAGGLPTIALGSGTPAQISTTRDVFLYVPVTYTPTAGAAATCAVALSPDNVTYTTLSTETVPLGTALDSFILSTSVWVPAGWYVRLTVTNATIGTATYW